MSTPDEPVPHAEPDATPDPLLDPTPVDTPHADAGPDDQGSTAPAPDGGPAPEPEAGDEGSDRLDQLGEEIAKTRQQAADDLEPGGAGRIFSDTGTARQVEAHGDTAQTPEELTGEEEPPNRAPG